ncbi:unnamed protein product, partial [Urochloa humidicola]
PSALLPRHSLLRLSPGEPELSSGSHPFSGWPLPPSRKLPLSSRPFARLPLATVRSGGGPRGSCSTRGPGWSATDGRRGGGAAARSGGLLGGGATGAVGSDGVWEQRAGSSSGCGGDGQAVAHLSTPDRLQVRMGEQSNLVVHSGTVLPVSSKVRQDLRAVIHGNNTLGVYITLRMLLRFEIFRNGKAMPWKATTTPRDAGQRSRYSREILCYINFL